jgi:RHS repeat-associated protein
MVPSGWSHNRAPAGLAPEYSSPERAAGPRPLKDVAADNAISAPAVVTYREMHSGVNLRYQVQSGGLKEDIMVAHRAAPAEYSFDIAGADLILGDDGGVRLSGAIGELFSIPAPRVATAGGADATDDSGVHYNVSDPNGAEPGMRLSVVVDGQWLATQSDSAFPIEIDPSFWSLSPTSEKSYSDQGDVYTGPGIKLGRESSGKKWRSALRFDEYENYFGGAYRVHNARLEFNVTGGGASVDLTQTPVQAFDENGQPSSFSAVGGTSIPTMVHWFDHSFMIVAERMDDWLTQSLANRWFGFRGVESGITFAQYDVRLDLTIEEPPQQSEVTNIEDGQVLATTTPEFRALAVPPRGDGALPNYVYEITTDSVPRSGTVVLGVGSTGSNHPWTVPPGTLRDGMTYYVWVWALWPMEDFLPVDLASEMRRFTVNLGLGGGGASPTDKIGAVPGSASSPAEGAPSPGLPASNMTVNMVNGNLSLSMGSKTMGTLSGGASLGFTYNSRTNENLGLRGVFFNDTNSNGQIDDGVDQQVAERIDSRINFDDLSVLAQDQSKALARWTGFLTLPASQGPWQLGAISSDGLKITVDGIVRLDRWATHEPEPVPVFGSSFSATGKPINVEWRNSSGEAVAHVVAKNSAGQIFELSPDWLSREPRSLPAGWTLNGDATSARWIGLEDHGTSVLLLAADGSGHQFVAAGNGSYSPPITAPTDLLSPGNNGRFVLQTEAGQTYTFRPDGQLESLVTAADAPNLNPAALEYGYSGTPLRLRTVRDRVSDRTVTLSYGGETECGTVPDKAAGMLCRISYWDNTITTLSYNLYGQLVRFTHPGNITYDLGYYIELVTGRALLHSVRDPLAAEAVAAGIRTDDSNVLTEIYYWNDGVNDGKVATVIQPAPVAGAARPQRSYTYGTSQTEVDVAGFSPPEPPHGTGFAQRVRYDKRSRITERTDAAGLTTTYTWDAFDRQVATTDLGTGLRTTTRYEPANDPKGRPTKQYGPAPTSSFQTNGEPVVGATVPTTTTEYDGGIVGLAATYWTNPFLAGAPGRHGTGLGGGGDMDKDWNMSPPVTPGTGGWSARFNGELKLTTADDYTFQIETRGSSGRIWVDDELVADLTQAEPATGWGTNTGAARALPVGTHRIRVDMVDTSGPAGLRILWKRTGAPTFVTLPGSTLSPAYGLVTQVADPDGKIVRTEYTDSATGIGPEYRLPTATVVDPNGANLRTVTTYETPGPGSYLRRVGRTLPAGNTTSTINYGRTEPPAGGSGAASIGVRATSVGQNIPPATTVVLPTPAGVTADDVMVAAVAVRGVPTVTAPAGWTLIRSDSNGSSMKLLSYWRVATSSETANYTWSFSSAKAAAGTITAYTGVNTANPVDVHSGFANTTDSPLIVAPSVTTTGADERLIGLFSIMKVTPIAPPTGLQELAETSSSGGSEPPVTIESADTSQPIAGASGDKTATAGTADRNNGQLIALRPLATGPCGVPASTPQAGMPKRITQSDPDGTGPAEARVEEFVYNSAGRQVGRRIGTTGTISTAAWSCLAFDERDRTTSQTWPATTTAPARTLTHLYAVGGNPLVNALTDSVWSSTRVEATIDLLNRVVSYTDIVGETTTTTYDQAGRVTNVNGPAGNRSQNYTPEGRASTVQVDGVTLATPAYDAGTGRLTSVTYANGTTTTLGYDTFGRSNATGTSTGSTTVTGDRVTYSLGKRVKDQEVYTGSAYLDADPADDNYTYDAAGRLTNARLPGSTFAYSYGTSAACTAPNAGKNSNRSTATITGTGAGSTAYCYDHADRLISGTDYSVGTIVYDDHGNTTQLGDKTLDFDATDRHVRTATPTTVTRYWRDPLNRIVDRADMTKTTFVAATTATATGTGITINRPTGTQAGDLIIAGLTIANPGANLTASGWTVAATQAQGTQKTWILWRYAAESDPSSWPLSTDGSTTNLSAAAATYHGPNSLTPVAVTAATTTTTATSHPLPQVTTTSDASQLIHVVGFAGATTPTAPGGVTDRASQAGTVSVLLADRYMDRPGTATATNATTGSPLSSASLTVAIVPGTTEQRLGYAGHTDSPNHLDDTSGALIERYYSLPGGVTITEKATSTPTTVVTDDFTGTNGAGWNSSKWTTTSNDSGKKVDIQSNQGELYVNGSSTRATATMTPVSDSETTFSYRFSDRNASSFFRVFTRASGAVGANQMPNAYRLEIASNSSTIVLQKFVNSVVSQIGSYNYTADTNTQRVRFRVQGSTIQAKVWPDGTTEPSSWSVTATDNAVTSPGVLQMAHSHTSGARSVYIDNLGVTRDVAERTWSYSNLHGDVTATVNNAGQRQWLGWYGPYGDRLTGSTPNNSAASGTTWGWHGNQRRLSDRDLTHMGARPYSPSLGRFLAVDPVEGGCENDFVYPSDPVNSSDLAGLAKCPRAIAVASGIVGVGDLFRFGHGLAGGKSNTARSLWSFAGGQMLTYGLKTMLEAATNPSTIAKGLAKSILPLTILGTAIDGLCVAISMPGKAGEGPAPGYSNDRGQPLGHLNYAGIPG